MLYFPNGEAVLKHPRPSSIFLLEPYIPMDSIIVLHGKAGIGKSALAWTIAEAIQTGAPFLEEMPTTQTEVLYLCFDMPMFVLQNRWGSKPDNPAFHFHVCHEKFSFDSLQFNLQAPDSRHKLLKEQLLAIKEKVKPGFVIVDSSREIHIADVKDSSIPKRLYDSMQRLFEASVMLLHHDRKDSEYSFMAGDREAAIGTQEWTAHAQVTLRLARQGKGLFLIHSKSQVGEEYDRLALTFEGGIVVESRDKGRIDMIRQLRGQLPDKPAREFDELVATELKLSERRARALRLALEQKQRG